MKKNTKWIILLTISLASTIALFSGVVLSLYITNPSRISVQATVSTKNNATNVANKETSNNFNILVMGDSLARGTGDEKGNGFGNDFAKLWKAKTNKPIKVTNLGVNGDTSSGLLNIVTSEQTKDNIVNSDIIIISIGGNEVKNFKNTDLTALTADSKTALNNYLNNVKTIFKTIRNENKNSLVVFIGLYNPFGQNITDDKIRFLEQWNYQTDELVSQDTNSIFIPTYDLFKYNLQDYMAADNFHPNSTGYEAISKRMFESLNNSVTN